MCCLLFSHYKKTTTYWGKKSSICRRNNVIPTTYRRNKSSEIIPRNFFIRRNSEETHFRGNSEEHQFVGNLLGIYRRSTSSGYTSIDVFLDIYPSIDPFIKTRSEYTEGHLSSEHVPRYIPRNMSLGIFRGKVSLGIFRGRCPSVYSERFFINRSINGYMSKNASIDRVKNIINFLGM